jgi:hypothetical protein
MAWSLQEFVKSGVVLDTQAVTFLFMPGETPLAYYIRRLQRRRRHFMKLPQGLTCILTQFESLCHETSSNWESLSREVNLNEGPSGRRTWTLISKLRCTYFTKGCQSEASFNTRRMIFRIRTVASSLKMHIRTSIKSGPTNA